jgi:hypothetical protein
MVGDDDDAALGWDVLDVPGGSGIAEIEDLQQAIDELEAVEASSSRTSFFRNISMGRVTAGGWAPNAGNLDSRMSSTWNLLLAS